MKLHKVIKRLIIICFCLGAAGLLVLIGINAHIKGAVQDRIVETESLPDEEYDCIMVLGCQVKDGGEPSHMLRDRIQRGVEVHEYGASEKLLMSGDHGKTDYNEVETMKQYAIDEGIESEDIFMDHAGQSMRDLREVSARAKDFVTTIVKPEPTYLGDFIDIHGDGNVTND